MGAGRMLLPGVVVAAALLAGCATNLGTQITSNAKVRDEVMAAIAGHGALAQEMTQRLVATDSLRIRVIETMLSDPASAQYVLARIGHNTEAVDYVMQSAASDSAGRVHLLTLLKGMQMVLKSAGK
jgi:hypothetical protein